MEVMIQDTAETASRTAAALAAEEIRDHPDTVLGLATGSTPLGLYREWIRLHSDEGLDFGRVTSFNLDEYVGLPADHPCSYRYFMQEQLFNHINIRPDRVHIPNGTAGDLAAECAAYEQAIRDAGGIDVQVLGIGSDGHIGFNEPGGSLASRTRREILTAQTRRDNARFFDNPEDVPLYSLTMGIGTILESRRILLLAFGEHKADILAKAVEGPVTASVPASVLQMHPHVTVFVDEPGAASLARVDHYKWVMRHSLE